MSLDSRYLAVKVLNRFESSNQQLSLIRQNLFSQFKPEGKIKARTLVLSNECVRLKDRLDFCIEFISGKELSRLNFNLISILRIGFYEIIYDENVPNYAAVDSAVELTKKLLNKKASSLTNAVLRNLIRKQESNSTWYFELEKKSRWHSTPKWLQNRWKEQFGDAGAHALMSCFNKPSKTFIRVNTTSISVTSVQSELEKLGIESSHVFGPFLKLNTGAGKILFTDMFQSGKISIQNPAAGAIVNLLDLNEGETVLDICAAPGTKSLYMAEQVGTKGKVFAYDVDKMRIQRGLNDQNRHSYNMIKWDVKDATKDPYPMADKILLDVPCSGTGVIGRKPDIRWRRKAKDIQAFSSLQFSILTHISKYLNPGGTLVYGTCTLEPEENWNVVERFLKLNPSFQLIKNISNIPENWINKNGCLQTSPHVHGIDGMFAATLTRT